jgi:hypothetical protein
MNIGQIKVSIRTRRVSPTRSEQGASPTNRRDTQDLPYHTPKQRDPGSEGRLGREARESCLGCLAYRRENSGCLVIPGLILLSCSLLNQQSPSVALPSPTTNQVSHLIYDAPLWSPALSSAQPVDPVPRAQCHFLPLLCCKNFNQFRHVPLTPPIWAHNGAFLSSLPYGPLTPILIPLFEQSPRLKTNQGHRRSFLPRAQPPLPPVVCIIPPCSSSLF